MTVKGEFAEVRGEGEVTDDGAVSGRIDISAASLHTGIKKRDDHLRSAEFFDVERFPEFSVIVVAADPADGDGVDLSADIVIKDVSHRLPLRATVAVLEDGTVRVAAGQCRPRTNSVWAGIWSARSGARLISAPTRCSFGGLTRPRSAAGRPRGIHHREGQIAATEPMVH